MSATCDHNVLRVGGYCTGCQWERAQAVLGDQRLGHVAELQRHRAEMLKLDERLKRAIDRAMEDDASLDLGTQAVGVEDDAALELMPSGWEMVPSETVG